MYIAQNDWAIEKHVMCKRDFTRFKMCFGGYPIVHSPTGLNTVLYIKVQWNVSITTTEWDTSLPSGAHLGGPWSPRWPPEDKNC